MSDLTSIPTKFLDMLPTPIAVLALEDSPLNHPIVYVNSSFDSAIGWNLEDIPDKEHWWKKAYPDPNYQKTVENLWELYIESAGVSDKSFAMMTVNIMTKYHGVKRFKIHTELKSALIDGYYIVAFKEVDV